MNKKLIKNKNFMLLIVGKLVSLLGSNLMQFALSLYVLDRTGSASIFASMLSISILPRIIFSPLAGVFGDWFDRKKSIVALDLINALIIGIFARVFILHKELSIGNIYLLVILLETTEIFFDSAMSGAIPSLVDQEQLLDANSFNSMVMSFGSLLSPIIGSILYTRFGLELVLVINALSFLLSSISEAFISMPKNHKQPDKINLDSFKLDLKEGLNFIKDNSFLKSLVVLAAFLNFSIAPMFSIGFNFILRDFLAVSSYKYSFFQVVLSLSMLLAPLSMAIFSKKYSEGRLIYRSFIYVSITIFIVVLATTGLVLGASQGDLLAYILLIACGFIVGFFITISNIVIGTIFNRIVPLDMMGRIGTILGLLSTISIPIGQMIFGFMYDSLAPSLVNLLIALIFLVASLRSRKIFLNYDIMNDKNKIRGELIEDQL